MRLSRYGIVFESLTADHLEMVRLWRNQDYIREKMQVNRLLSRKDQEEWFRNLDSTNNVYWIIRYNQYPIGLIHIKDIVPDQMEGEAGIFIGEPSFLEMPQAMLAILFMMELGFFGLGLNRLKAKIHNENKKAIRFNLNLGYQLEPKQPDGFQYYSVIKEQFEVATETIRNSSIKTYGANTAIDVGESYSIWEKKLANLGADAKQYFKLA